MSTATARIPERLLAGWPRSGRASVVGIEAAEEHLCLAQWSVRRNLRVWRAAEVSLAGGLADAGAAARQIRAAAKAAGIAGGPAVCAICTPKVDVFPLTLRAVATESLDEQVAVQAVDRLNCSPDEVVLDYARLPAQMTRDSEHGVSVLVFAVPRALAEGLLRALDRTGFEVERLMTPACALAAALSQPAPAERHVVVFPAHEATSISVVEAGHVLLERILPWSVRGLVGHMHAELDLEVEQCRRLLLQDSTPAGAMGDPFPTGAGNARGSLEAALREILGPFFQDLSREVAGCLGYSDSFLRRARIAGVVLTGPMAGNGLLREFVAKASDLPFVDLEGRDGLPRRGECGTDFACTPAASCALWPREERP